MRDRTESTPHAPPFDPDSALRATYAHQLRPRERRILQALSRAVLELTREAPMIVKDIPNAGVVSDLRAAVADLRYLGAYLDQVGEGCALDRSERRSCAMAERVAAQIRDQADELEAAT